MEMDGHLIELDALFWHGKQNRKYTGLDEGRKKMVNEDITLLFPSTVKVRIYIVYNTFYIIRIITF